MIFVRATCPFVFLLAFQCPTNAWRHIPISRTWGSKNIVMSARGSKRNRNSKVVRDLDGVPADTIVARRSRHPSTGGSGAKKIRPQGQARQQAISNPNRLRIIAGSAKGTKLMSPDVYLRPMMGRVKEALFSTFYDIGMFKTGQTRVLDMFAGSGSIGLEAVSRGAGHATFVDLSSDCTKTAIANAEKCGFSDQVAGVCARAEDVLGRPEAFGLTKPYDLISITPPYQEVVYSELIQSIYNSPLIQENTVVVIEYPKEMGDLPFVLGEDRLFGMRNRRYGRTVIAMYVYRPTRTYDLRPAEFAPPAPDL